MIYLLFLGFVCVLVITLCAEAVVQALGDRARRRRRARAYIARLADYQWQYPACDDWDKGYARGYENACHNIAADLQTPTGGAV